MAKRSGKSGADRDQDGSAGLTAREIELVALVIKGLSEREIAGSLGIAQSTVHFHVGQARRKLGARNRAQLAALAVAHGPVCGDLVKGSVIEPTT